MNTSSRLDLSPLGRRIGTVLAGWLLVATPALVSACGDGDDGCTETLPTGSYEDSCSDCTMDGTTVSCMCGNGSQDVEASLDTCNCNAGDEVWNNHGTLECTAPSSGDSCKKSGRYCGKSNTNTDECCSGRCGDGATCE